MKRTSWWGYVMQKNKNRGKLFGSDRTREWATDFMIGIGMFLLVAFFASTHTRSALPAPLAKTQAALEQTAITTPENSFIEPAYTGSITSLQNSNRGVQNNGPSNTNMTMIFMALVFSTLLTLTIQFWRNLRREYASPRRKWGKG